MWKDPIVAEVRETRKKLEERHGNSFQEIYRKAAEIQRRYNGEVLVATPRKKLDLPAAKT